MIKTAASCRCNALASCIANMHAALVWSHHGAVSAGLWYPHHLLQVFQGNLDGNTTVKQILFQGIVTQFVRVVAKNCKGLCCLRLELYGASGMWNKTVHPEIKTLRKVYIHVIRKCVWVDSPGKCGDYLDLWGPRGQLAWQRSSKHESHN